MHNKKTHKKSYEHYTTDAYAQDIIALLQRYKSEDTVLICHSYGCGVATHLYSRLEASDNSLYHSIKAIVMIGPKALVTPHEMNGKRKLAKTPDWAIDFARKLDRWGGIHSKSVNRLLHASAGDDLRRKQLRWNKESTTFVLRRLLLGVQYPTPDDFRKIQCPILLMVGEDVRTRLFLLEITLLFEWRSEAEDILSLQEKRRLFNMFN